MKLTIKFFLFSLILAVQSAKAADIELPNKSFKWKVTMSEIGKNGPGITKSFDQPVDGLKLQTGAGDCYLSILPALKTDNSTSPEQSVNLTCNSFSTGALCREGDKRSGWLSGVLEGKNKVVAINVTCDQYDGSSFHDSFWDHLKDVIASLWH